MAKLDARCSANPRINVRSSVVVRSIDQDTMHAAVTRIAEAYRVGRSGITT